MNERASSLNKRNPFFDFVVMELVSRHSKLFLRYLEMKKKASNDTKPLSIKFNNTVNRAQYSYGQF